MAMLLENDAINERVKTTTEKRQNDRFASDGLTFDDVLLVPGYSEVLPSQANTQTFFTKKITLNTPIVSAAMDTVTESAMAIAIAQEGGIGVIHKNMSIGSQANEVRKVKRSESGMIQDPITLEKSALVKDALSIMSEHGIGGIPIVSKEGILLGIITNRDLRFEKNADRPIEEIMTKQNLVTASPDVDLKKAEDILQDHKIEKLPVVDKNQKLVGLITYRDIIKIKEHPLSCKDGFGRLRVAAAVGVTEDVMDRVDALVKAGVDAIAVDTAHGHSKRVIETLARIKSTYSELEVIGGNVATYEGARALVEAGADGVKVGIGPGSICTTRVIAGVGVPQLTAIQEVSFALEGTNVPLIADGGIRYTGDVVKAIAAGANTVMVGSLLAGVEEAPGETIIYEGRKFKAYRGMGSLEAMQKGSKDRYFQEDNEDSKKLVPEGISGRVPFKGKLVEVMTQFIGGLKAGMGYCGAKNLTELKTAKFIRITSAGVSEGHPHDVHITREAPNYSLR